METGKSKIVLTEEKETLLIPLYGKAQENKKEKPILADKKAAEIINEIDYDFSSLQIAEKTSIMMCLRAKLIDGFARDLLSGTSRSVALHLGCGLDNRYGRIGDSEVEWFDVDFSEVIEIRKNFYEETDRYHMIASSVADPDWMERIPHDKMQYVVIAEGLLMYLKESEIRTLIGRLRERIGGFVFIFDAFSMLTVEKSNNHPSLKKTGARIYWGLDDPQELTRWGLGIQFLEEQYFTENEEIENMDFGFRVMFKIANYIPAAKKAHRILVYLIN